MILKTRASKLTYEDLANDNEEILLVSMAMCHFYGKYLPKLRDEIILMLGRQDWHEQARRFNLDAYFEARVWLGDHRSLSATLELRKAYPPGWMVRF